MAVDRRSFAKSLGGVVGAALGGMPRPASTSAQAPASSAAARTAGRLAPAKVTRIRLFYPQNYDRNGPQAFPQSNMIVLVDTEAGITGVGQGGSPDTVRNVARSVIGRNAFPSSRWISVMGSAEDLPRYQRCGGPAWQQDLSTYFAGG